MSRAKYDKVNDRLILIAGKEDTSVPTFTMAEWEAMTDAQKAEYDGKLFVISDDFNGMTVDDELSDTSIHPVQNKVITEELANCAEKTDLTSINITGTTNNTGSPIGYGSFFYLNGVLVRAITGIASGATFTLNTNYEVVPAGGLNKIVDKLTLKIGDIRKDNVTVPAGDYAQIDITNDIPSNVNFYGICGFDVWNYTNKLIPSMARWGNQSFVVFRVINVDTVSRSSTIVVSYLYTNK